MKQYTGTGVAIVTPFKDGAVDYSGLEKVVEHIISGGVEYLVVLGSTGEANMISAEEAALILDKVIEVNNSRVPLVSGHLSGIHTHAIAEKLHQFKNPGIDAFLMVSPAYVKPSQEGIYRHFMTLAEASPLPIIIYNVPGRTNSNMEPETTIRLARAHENLIGIKEASGDLQQIKTIIDHKPSSFFVTSGDDPTALESIHLGGVGVISVLGNALPREFSNMIRLGLEGKAEAAKLLNDRLDPFHEWMYVEGNPPGIKCAMNLLGVCDNELRLPLTAVSEKTKQEISNLIEKIKS